MPVFGGIDGHHFPPHIRYCTLQSSLHPKDVSSSICNRAELWLLIFVTTSNVGFEPHTQHKCVMSPFLCSGTPCHGISKAFIWEPHCILCAWYHLQWWAVKKNYSLPVVWKNHMVKHMASKNKWPVALRYVFSNNITSVVWQNGWFTAKAWMRTKSCSTISTPSSCCIDLPVGHRPPPFPLVPPSTQLRPRTVLVISFHQPSRGALTNQLPASCWLALLEATTGPWFWGKTLCFSQPILLCVWLSQHHEASANWLPKQILFTVLTLNTALSWLKHFKDEPGNILHCSSCQHIPRTDQSQ